MLSLVGWTFPFKVYMSLPHPAEEPHTCICRVQVFQRAWAILISSLYQSHGVFRNTAKLKMKWVRLASQPPHDRFAVLT